MASRACLRRNGPRSGLSSESSASGAGAGEGEGFRGLAREEAEGDGDGGARRGSGDESRRGGGAADGGELSEAARPGMVLGGEGEQTASLVVEMERRGGGRRGGWRRLEVARYHSGKGSWEGQRNARVPPLPLACLQGTTGLDSGVPLLRAAAVPPRGMVGTGSRWHQMCRRVSLASGLP